MQLYYMDSGNKLFTLGSNQSVKYTIAFYLHLCYPKMYFVTSLLYVTVKFLKEVNYETGNTSKLLSGNSNLQLW